MVTISAVIPTHRRPDLLRRAIDSVLEQTYLAHEIIVVDDACCEKTKALINSYSYPSLIYVGNEDGSGAASSRNLGVKNATGEYVAFLDDDDIWLPTKLEKQADMIKLQKLDVCFSRLLVKYENSDICYSTSTVNVSDPHVEILMENYIGATISAVVLRSLFDSIGGFDLNFKAREEYDLWIRLIHSGAAVGVVEEPLAISFRSLENRARISLNVSNYVSAIALLNKKHGSLVEEVLSSQQRLERKKRQYDFIAAQAVSIGLKKDAVYYYFKSLQIRPSVKSLVGLLVSFVSPKILIKLREKIS